jgi:hypothetical protein
MKKLNTGVITTEVNGRVEVESPYFKEDNNRKEKYERDLKVIGLGFAIFVCLLLGFGIVKLF